MLLSKAYAGTHKLSGRHDVPTMLPSWHSWPAWGCVAIFCVCVDFFCVPIYPCSRPFQSGLTSGTNAFPIRFRCLSHTFPVPFRCTIAWECILLWPWSAFRVGIRPGCQPEQAREGGTLALNRSRKTFRRFAGFERVSGKDSGK